MKDFRELVNSWVIPPQCGWKCRCGVELEFPGVCDACGEREERRRAVDRVMDRVATIPSHLRWATFESEELPLRCKAGLSQAQKAVKGLVAQKVQGVVLLGPVGAGKTSLACAMLRSLLDTPLGFSGRFCSAVRLAACRTDSGLGSIPVELADAMAASVIVLDDIGQEPDRNAPVITETMQARYNDGKPTIVTTWLDPSEITTRYGAGTARRILEHSAIVRLS